MSFLLQHLMIETAQKLPDKEAVVYNDQSISYRELDEITNKLARVLRGNGIKRGDRVGIYINKSIPAVISTHAILKAGGVYVPLDPNAPPKRLAYIIQNCGIKCLLTSTRKAGSVNQLFPKDSPLDVVVLTDDGGEPKEQLSTRIVSWQEVVDHGDASLPENLSIDTDLAYILYTSGSTGDPKGVMISHLNALTFVNWAFDAFGIKSEDRLSNHAPFHFDLSIFDIFVSFKAGATLVLVPEGSSTFPFRLAEWIESNRISVWYSVPSILSMLVLHGQLDRFKYEDLRLILFAGEVFPVKFLRSLIETIPQAEYYNLYGPTETNVVTYYKVPRLEPDRLRPIPIGKACANMEVFALTEDGELVTEPGQEGELFARGSCVAQGYWDDPDKTSENFITNHTQPFFQEKMYKIGDIVTMDEEGNYIFIGRRDHMIKSRGYRIELGEIEAVLYSHPQIREAGVIAIPDDLIGNRIKAFLVSSERNGLSAAEIQKHCSKHLPRYMIPEFIEFRSSLPKTSTGKIAKTLLAQNSSS